MLSLGTLLCMVSWPGALPLIRNLTNVMYGCPFVAIFMLIIFIFHSMFFILSIQTVTK